METRERVCQLLPVGIGADPPRVDRDVRTGNGVSTRRGCLCYQRDVLFSQKPDGERDRNQLLVFQQRSIGRLEMITFSGWSGPHDGDDFDAFQIQPVEFEIPFSINWSYDPFDPVFIMIRDTLVN